MVVVGGWAISDAVERSTGDGEMERRVAGNPVWGLGRVGSRGKQREREGRAGRGWLEVVGGDEGRRRLASISG